MKYDPPALLFITNTPEGILANVMLGGVLTKIPLTRRHALALLGQLADAIEWSHHLADNRDR